MLILSPQIPTERQRRCKTRNTQHILQEVLAAAWSRGWNMPLVIADGTEKLKGRFEVITDFADRGQISTAVAVVWRAPYSDHILVVEVILVAFVHQLMGTCDQGEIVDMAELIGHSVSEKPS